MATAATTGCAASLGHGKFGAELFIVASDALLAASAPNKDEPEGAPSERRCSDHPDAPHGFDRNASHNAGRYVCECEVWEPFVVYAGNGSATTSPDDAGWIEWKGGGCPVPEDTVVEVKLRDAPASPPYSAGAYTWEHNDKSPRDIIAYRVVQSC